MDKKRFSLSLIDGFVMGIVCSLLCEFSVSAYAVELSVRAMWLIAAACAVISAIVLLFTLPKNADGRLIARLTLAGILGFGGGAIRHCGAGAGGCVPACFGGCEGSGGFN